MSKNSIAIGIDLGTTNSCVAVMRNSRVEIIANDMGHRITPSFVAFTDSERLVGNAAKEQAAWNPKNTVFDMKRLIGRKFDDPDIQKMIKYCPFTVKNNEGNPKVEVTHRELNKVFTPEQISSMVLMKMKEVAETYLNCEVKDAVITVPAYFNDSQRQATIDAGKIAGLNVLSIINEPTAAAIAYGVDIKDENNRNVLIFDLGGGTFDVVILKIKKNVFDVLAVNGDTFLGGGDFDQILIDHFIKEFNKKCGVDISHHDRALGKLRKECEKVKRNLSSSKKERVQIESLANGIDLVSSLSRIRFEELCSNLFNKTLQPVESVLLDAKLTKSEIDEVVLVGGSTRIPRIQELLQDYFQGKLLNKTINPDEAVAYGAAFHAAVLSGEPNVDEVLLLDVTPMSLGIEDHSGSFVNIINHNTKIPSKNTVKRTTVCDFQKTVVFKIYEGEQQVAKCNHFLGSFILKGIEIAPKGLPSFECTFEIDRNGILHASAVDKRTGGHKNITITSNKGRLNQDEIKCMMVEAQQFKEDEKEQRVNLIARGNLESLCGDIKSRIHKKKSDDKGSYVEIEQACDDLLAWIYANENSTKNECLAKKTILLKLSAELL